MTSSTEATGSTGATDAAPLGPRLLQSLEQVFDWSWPVFVTDSRELLAWLLDERVHAVHFSHLADMTAKERSKVVVIPTTLDGTPSHDVWQEQFAESRVLIVPGISFDPSFPAMRYTLEKLAESSIADAVANNVKTLDAVVGAATLTVRSGAYDLQCAFEDEVTVLRPKVEVELDRGEWESVGAYFEVGLVSMPDEFMTGIKPGFRVDGEFEVNGTSVACHRHVGGEVRSMAAAAWSLLRQVSVEGGFPLLVTVENAAVRKVVTADGRDLAADVLRLTNAELGCMLTELAFSTNGAMAPERIDWTVNSQLNEGALGVHIAAGEGLTGAHIDFIATGATTTFTS